MRGRGRPAALLVLAVLALALGSRRRELVAMAHGRVGMDDYTDDAIHDRIDSRVREVFEDVLVACSGVVARAAERVGVVEDVELPSRGVRHVAPAYSFGELPIGEEALHLPVGESLNRHDCEHTVTRYTDQGKTQGGQRENEVDPLVCPRCASTMHVVGFISEPTQIKRILNHLRKQKPLARPPPDLAHPVASTA